MSGTLIRGAEVAGAIVDVVLRDGRIAEIGTGPRRRAGDEVVDAGGGALIVGLHDHHLHLMAMAAAETSVDLSTELDAALRSAATSTPIGGWIRAVGYHEATAGHLDRARLDALVPQHPVRVQHRSGHAWILNSAALALAARTLGDRRDLSSGILQSSVELGTGAETGGDGWVVDRDGELSAGWPAPAIDLAAVGRRLSGYGITSVTDATPTNDLDHLATLAAGVRAGDLPFRVGVTGGIGLVGAEPPAPLGRGPVKLMVPDGEGVDLDALAASIELVHGAGRAVALHCVTAVAAAIALAAWETVGSAAGDRMEHGAVLSDDVVVSLRRLGIRVVTQPGFVSERGDHYLAEVEADELPHLYRCASLLDAGLDVWGSSDAPFGPDDPWAAMRAAVDRRTASGVVLGAAERVSPAQALALWSEGRVDAGASADVVLLDCPLNEALAELDASHVVATFVGGTARSVR